MEGIESESLRCLVQDCLAKHMYTSATFYADLLVSRTAYEPGDVYLLAQTYFVSRQHRRAISLLRRHGQLHDERFRYLTARCLAELADWEECLLLLGEGEPEAEPAAALAALDKAMPSIPAGQGVEISTTAAVWLLRGRAHEALDNLPRAAACFAAALRHDPYCHEALVALTSQHLMTNAQELELLGKLSLRPCDRWLGLLYTAQCKKYLQRDSMEDVLLELERPPQGAGGTCSAGPDDMAAEPTTPDEASTHGVGQEHSHAQQQQQQQAGSRDCASPGPSSNAAAAAAAASRGWGLHGSMSVSCCRADWLLAQGRYEEAYELSSSLLEADTHAAGLLPAHLTAALQLGKTNELFLLAHTLVDAAPDSWLSWYAVGVYYMATRAYEQARLHFARATQLNPRSAAAWLGAGHAFAEQDESDQALAAYRTAARLFPGLHTPLLGMGCAYGAMSNAHLGQRCLLQAQALCPHDPAVAHELGVLAYRSRQYEAASSWLTTALELLPAGHNAMRQWQPTLVALAHARRKLRDYSSAAALYNRALRLCPHDAGAMTGLGLTHQLAGDSAAASEWFHRALALRPDDALAGELLSAALADEATRFSRQLMVEDPVTEWGGVGDESSDDVDVDDDARRI